ncbi:cache domain-containing protein [Anaerobacillus sp. HL2]|nr:cache domain-containing protein [Anaerobacillus sp. HL2]
MGNTYQAGYIPILDVSGKAIGIWYVGASQAFIDETIKETMKMFLLILVVAFAAIIILLIWYTRKINNSKECLRSECCWSR